MSKATVWLLAARGGRMLTGSLARQIVEPQLDLLSSTKAHVQGHALWQELISARLSWSSKSSQRLQQQGIP